MRVVLVAESFLPHMNGVTHTLLQMLRHLEARGHEALVIGPRVGRADHPGDRLHGASLALLRSVPLPSYPEVRVTFARARRLAAMIEEFQPDVVHLASPFVLGWQGLRAAESLGIPTVAIYQTDIPGYAKRYGIPGAEPAFAQHVARIHGRATVTLAPSSSAVQELSSLGVDNLRIWTRGVDGERFAPEKRSASWRNAVAPGGEVIIGYVGRLAPEKQVDDLRALADIPNTRLVIVGDGPSRAALEKALPQAVFLGFLGGDDLAEAVASFDLFVHPGENETFCQTVQEALVSGVPVIATGRGGPLDLVQNSRTGWLYRPGDLDDFRRHVADLAGDPAKRAAFAAAARASVAHRTWSRLGDELIGHYESAIEAKRTGTAIESAAPADAARGRGWRRYVALGDSITEGMCDASAHSPGQYRGWADRLAHLLGPTTRPSGMQYANLAVRSRTIGDLIERQVPRAIELRADLVSILIGGNDLTSHRGSTRRLVRRLAAGVARLRATGAHVLIVTPYIPRRPFLVGLHRRTARFGNAVEEMAVELGAVVVNLSRHPEFEQRSAWDADRVHLSPAGHRTLAYLAAEALGVPAAQQLGSLDAAMHDAAPAELSTPRWLLSYAKPWLWRRLRGRTLGDGRSPRHDALVAVGRLMITPSRDRSEAAS